MVYLSVWFLSLIRLCRERFETMLVATIRYLPDVSTDVLCLIGENKEHKIEETIADAFRDTVPPYVVDHLVIKVVKISFSEYVLIHHTEDDGQMMSPPACALVRIKTTPVYGKD